MLHVRYEGYGSPSYHIVGKPKAKEGLRKSYLPHMQRRATRDFGGCAQYSQGRCRVNHAYEETVKTARAIGALPRRSSPLPWVARRGARDRIGEKEDQVKSATHLQIRVNSISPGLAWGAWMQRTTQLSETEEKHAKYVVAREQERHQSADDTSSSIRLPEFKSAATTTSHKDTAKPKVTASTWCLCGRGFGSERGAGGGDLAVTITQDDFGPGANIQRPGQCRLELIPGTSRASPPPNRCICLCPAI
ncbi:hypothetical protein FN846DRAFT_889929 [Sphaerosporella brunnea]|uniref:Uncharacterized protein n=1 Tax=Sphaerosporella brunnea TaxID=1250544 RepID=A0A5J5EY73_9PEZI|nr:hypothetical protein FN846DRAFT_889929 [Sphaerosporella brunnea]